MSYEKIAAALEISPAGVRKIEQRALAKLRGMPLFVEVLRSLAALAELERQRRLEDEEEEEDE